MSAPAGAKRLLTPGTVWDVTNHYISREDHPAFGTNRRTVTRTTGSRVYLAYDSGAESYVDYPKAAQVEVDGATVRFFGGGASQPVTDLFLTFTPVTP